MPRKRKTKTRTKTGYTAQEWRKKFAEAAKYCAEQAKRRGIRYQDCISDYLKK
jgi:hypothetical protein